VLAHFVVDAGLWRLRDPAARQLVASWLPYLLPGCPGDRELPVIPAADRSLTGIE
jgi:hypothetical protein